MTDVQTTNEFDDEGVAAFLDKLEADAAPRVDEDAKTRKRSLLALAKLGGDTIGTEDVLFKGKQLVLPETMTASAGIQFLERYRAAQEEQTEFSKVYPFRPYDGAHCFIAAVKKHFGAMRQVTTPGFFGPNPPELLTIATGPDTEEQIPWGRMVLPHLPDCWFETGATMNKEDGLCFVLSAGGPNKHRAHINGVFALVEEELKTASLYRGKAINGAQHPGFMNLSGVDKRVVYSEEVSRQLNANVWSLVEDSEIHEAAGLPLKRAVLFSGPYGTGKTLAAYLTAERCVANGWTFIYARPGQDDPFDVMKTARLYEPAVVFVEDVDTISGVDQEADDVSKLLDSFDGITAKGAKIVMVLTTNHAERIHKGMLRPGRLDAVIEIAALDPVGVQTLIEAVIPVGKLDPNVTEADWTRVVEHTEGFMPAFIREATERAVRYSIAEKTDGFISAQALCDAADGLRPQLDLMDAADELVNRPSVDKAIGEVVSAAMRDTPVKLQGDNIGTAVGFIDPSDDD